MFELDEVPTVLLKTQKLKYQLSRTDPECEKKIIVFKYIQGNLDVKKLTKYCGKLIIFADNGFI